MLFINPRTSAHKVHSSAAQTRSHTHTHSSLSGKMQPEQRRKSYTIWSDSGEVLLMRRLKRRTYGAIHLNSPSYLRCNLLLFQPISPCVFPFPQHPYIPSPHVKRYETQNILLSPLQSERGNVILQAKYTHTHTRALWLRCTHPTQGDITIYVC